LHDGLFPFDEREWSLHVFRDAHHVNDACDLNDGANDPYLKVFTSIIE